MNIKEKLVIVDRAIASIGTPTDEDSIVLLAALDHIKNRADFYAAELQKQQLERAAAATAKE